MDTQINLSDAVADLRRERRNLLLEEGELIEASDIGKRCGLTMQLAVTRTFFNHFYPYAEDATKGVSWEEILWDILKVFRKEAGEGRVKNGFSFGVLSKTYVKKAIDHEHIETFSDGNSRDKRTTVKVYLMPDEHLRPSLVLAIEDFKFIGGEN